MNTVAIIGMLWGDEGKGKIVDLLSEQANIVVRYQGGTNAGHTVCFKGKPLPLHMIPSGIFNEKTVCVIGNGCVINLKSLYEEILLLESEGVDVRGRLFISKRAHVTFPFHIEIDKNIEKKKGSRKLGTTFKGIGPCYTDKFARVGIRVVDMLQREELEALLESYFSTFTGRKDEFDIKCIAEDYTKIVQELGDYIIDTVSFLNREIDGNKRVVFESAQGTLLDVDFGTYPYVTSSNPTIGGVCTGTGVASNKIGRVIGVAKAYSTRVGKGPFPTQFEEGFEEPFRKKAKEYGATTGRPRRCGWFDAVGVGYSQMINGVSSIALTKLDCLSGVDKIKVCVAYKINGKNGKASFPPDTASLSRTKPVYEKFDGWEEDIRGVNNEKALPRNAIKYFKALEDILRIKISIVSTGPDRKDTILREKIW